MPSYGQVAGEIWGNFTLACKLIVNNEKILKLKFLITKNCSCSCIFWREKEIIFE